MSPEVALALAIAIGSPARQEPIWPATPPPVVRPPVIRPAKKLPAGPLHSHRCPYDGTTWVHGDDSHGNAAAHRCPQCGRLVWQVHARNVARPIAAAPPDAEGWVTPHAVVALPCPPGHH